MKAQLVEFLQADEKRVDSVLASVVMAIFVVAKIGECSLKKSPNGTRNQKSDGSQDQAEDSFPLGDSTKSGKCKT